MDAESSSQGESQRDSARCPRCGASRAHKEVKCGGCGIVYTKWHADQERLNSPGTPVSSGDEGAEPESHHALSMAVLLFVFLAAALGMWRFFTAGAPPAAAVTVTFDDGDQCCLTDWAFHHWRRYVETHTHGTGRAIVVGRTMSEVKHDHTLRVFGTDGEKLTIPGTDIREIRLDIELDPHTDKHRVTGFTVVNRGNLHFFEPEEIPRLSRSRVLVPVASHYFPQRVDDNYMEWATARVSLVGTPTAECEGTQQFSLTTDGYPKSRTPVRFELLRS